MLRRKPLRTFAHKIHMRTLTQDLPRRPHGIPHTLHAAHAAGAQSGTVHDQSIELNLAIAIQKAASAGIEDLVILHDDHSLFDSIERRASVLEHAPACRKSIPHSEQMRLNHVIGHGPGAAVNYEYGISRQEELLRK